MKRSFRARLYIVRGSYGCWCWEMTANWHGGRAGGGPVKDTPIAVALAEYCRYLRGMKYDRYLERREK